MTLLLDTHTVLWWRENSKRLTAPVRRAVASADIVWVSAASGWEVALKLGLGKLKLTESFVEMVEDSGFIELPVTLKHAERLAMLPPHHRDPFDRMLIAQAQVERITIVTHDRHFEPYDVSVLWL